MADQCARYLASKQNIIELFDDYRADALNENIDASDHTAVEHFMLEAIEKLIVSECDDSFHSEVKNG